MVTPPPLAWQRAGGATRRGPAPAALLLVASPSRPRTPPYNGPLPRHFPGKTRGSYEPLPTATSGKPRTTPRRNNPRCKNTRCLADQYDGRQNECSRRHLEQGSREGSWHVSGVVLLPHKLLIFRLAAPRAVSSGAAGRLRVP